MCSSLFCLKVYHGNRIHCWKFCIIFDGWCIFYYICMLQFITVCLTPRIQLLQWTTLHCTLRAWNKFSTTKTLIYFVILEARGTLYEACLWKKTKSQILWMFQTGWAYTIWVMLVCIIDVCLWNLFCLIGVFSLLCFSLFVYSHCNNS